MSRMGAKPIKIESGVTVTLKEGNALIKGKNGEICINIPTVISAKIDGDNIMLTRRSESKSVKAIHGVMRKLLINAIYGVENMFEKKLDVIGVGYRVTLKGEDLELNIGFSHPVLVKKPKNISFKIQKNSIIVSGINKQEVGQIAAQIRAIRPPEPYKGKGIKYTDEIIKRKSGKAAKTAGAAAK